MGWRGGDRGSETGLDRGKASGCSNPVFSQSAVWADAGSSSARQPPQWRSQRIRLHSVSNPCCPGPVYCHFACKISISAGTSCFSSETGVTFRGNGRGLPWPCRKSGIAERLMGNGLFIRNPAAFDTACYLWQCWTWRYLFHECVSSALAVYFKFLCLALPMNSVI